MTRTKYLEKLGKHARSLFAKETKPTGPHHIPEEVYEALAEQLLDQIGLKSYAACLYARIETNEFEYTLVMSACIYWHDMAAPEGNYREMEKIVPIWWELHSYEGDDQIECLNDATFDKINEHIIEL